MAGTQREAYVGFQTTVMSREYGPTVHEILFEEFIKENGLSPREKANFRIGCKSIGNPAREFKFKCDLPIFYTERFPEGRVGPVAAIGRVWFKKINLQSLIKLNSNREIRPWRETYQDNSQQPKIACHELFLHNNVVGYQNAILSKIHCDWGSDNVWRPSARVALNTC